MCSTPQKQPAATVAVSEPAGIVIGAAGELMVAEEKGRNNRVRNDIKTKQDTKVSRYR